MAKDKQKKPRRPRAETPKGFRDYFGAEVRARAAMLARITEVYHAWGFDPLETSAVETVEALGKFLPDVDRPNEGVFAWQDEDEQWLALRYDLTAPLARVFAQHRLQLPTPYRRYAVGPVWRNEKPGPGRFRQFYQCDADTVGSASVAADGEICAMLGEALEAAGIPRGDYLIRVNNRKVLNGVMEVAGVLDPADPDRDAHRRGIVLRAIDKLDRLGEDGVRALLGEGRRDESGDFTKGAGLGDEQAAVILGFVNARAADGAGTCANLRALVAGSETGLDGVQELEAIAELLAAPRHRRDHRSLGRPRPRLLHRPGLRGRADLRDPRRRRQAAPVRLGRRRRPLRRPRQALHRRDRRRHRASRSASTACSPPSARRAG